MPGVFSEGVKRPIPVRVRSISVWSVRVLVAALGALSACSSGGSAGDGGTSGGGRGGSGTSGAGGASAGAGRGGGGSGARGGSSAIGGGGGSGSGGSAASGGSTARGGAGGGAGTGGGAATGGGAGGSGAPDCTSGPPTTPLAGSCDTRAVSGSSQEQCREWFGTTTIQLQTSCNGLGGAFSASAACPPDSRVARCVLPRALGLDTVYNYYSSRYTESQARASCAALGGWILGPPALQVDRAGAGSGQIDISPPGVICGGTKDDPAQEPCSQNLAAGEVVTLVARPDAMSRFAGYTGGGGCGTAASCQLTVAGRAAITAHFEPKTMQTPFAWSFGGPAFNADAAGRVVIGASGELYFQASFETSASFGGKNLTAGLRDVVIARLDPSTGAVQWSQQIGGSDYDNPAGRQLRLGGRPATRAGRPGHRRRTDPG